MIPCYQLIDVKVKNYVIQARPVAWDREIWDGEGNDKNGEPVLPTEFDTTCPFCANLIHFNTKDIFSTVESNVDNIECETCGASSQKLETKGEQPGVAAVAEIEAHHTTFRDPIAAGLFGEEVDLDRLSKIDLAKFGEAV